MGDLKSVSYRGIPLEDDDPPALVPGGQQVSVLVELDAGDDVGFKRKRKLCEIASNENLIGPDHLL